MLTNFFQWLGLSQNKKKLNKKGLERVVLSRSQHTISRKNISRAALKVLYRLREQGFEAYLVGGGVRDLLLAQHPKDFDLATNALPEEVYKLFRNSRMIGRRFRLVHVFFSGHIVEVATFRSPQMDTNEADLLHSEEGMILRDNIYGTLEEDVWRRDFTVNALYYNISDFSVIDYVGGLKDLENRCLRMIGNAELRYREDPVRMLRAIRFAGKLGFSIHPETEKPIYELGNLVRNVPAARLFEEFLKMFLTGHAVVNFQLLRHYELFKILFPKTEEALMGGNETFVQTFILNALKNTDKRVMEEKPVAPPFLWATLLWYPVRLETRKRILSGTPELPALLEAIEMVLKEQQKSIAIPKRFTRMIREIWILQVRLAKRGGYRAKLLFSHARFRAAYDFLILRLESGEKELEPLVSWWTEYINSDEETRLKMADAVQASGPKGRRTRHH